MLRLLVIFITFSAFTTGIGYKCLTVTVGSFNREPPGRARIRRVRILVFKYQR